MTNIKDLARFLVEKHGIKLADAELFISLMTEIINEGVHRERQVKIKGLGTFKLTSVSSRESIDVNTGERIVIEGRDKLSFAPDNAMKELVNQPFSQFETVVVNDGVELEDEYKEQVEETTPADIIITFFAVNDNFQSFSNLRLLNSCTDFLLHSH